MGADTPSWDRKLRHTGKHIQFPERLSLAPYLSATAPANAELVRSHSQHQHQHQHQQGGPVPVATAGTNRPPNYRLYAVLVHSGHTANSGHYYCYVRSPGGAWYCMNDSDVRPAAWRHMHAHACPLTHRTPSSRF